MCVYILALASPTHPVPANSWDVWTAKYDHCWRGQGETRHLAFAPLFGHQYSHVWVDFRGIRDKVMREAGIDYFENSRRATHAQRAYAIANPMGWTGYSKDIWGLTACDGPGGYNLPFKGRTATFRAYSARGPLGQPDAYDDGTLAPTAALGSLPFAPEIVIPAANALRKWPGLYSQYGFLDSFNPSFTWTDKSSPTAGSTASMAADAHRPAALRYAGFVERLDRGVVAGTEVERADIELRVRAQLVGEDLIGERQPVGAHAPHDIVAGRARHLAPGHAGVALIGVADRGDPARRRGCGAVGMPNTRRSLIARCAPPI
ncbi:putative glucoamylase domain-containing protein [Ditylenchus destructor]|uniref:Glucoamylase domain-containing protein n=1 Tax=Ditylenchus destructor TaxID=166010 RepID=A0AAD4QX15_9BILA|nr:putative glucoamylase domain-containing protein [Ditylenchus destructor]